MLSFASTKAVCLQDEPAEYPFPSCSNEGWIPKETVLSYLSDSEVQYIEYRLKLLQYIQDLSGETDLKPSHILPQLYISDLYNATSSQIVSDLGITHILSLHTANTELPFGTKRFSRLSIEVEDLRSEDLLSQLPLAVDFLRGALSSKHGSNRVLIHCTLGNGPSVAVLLAYLIADHHMSYGSAIDFVRRRKSGRVVINPGFESQLRLWETYQRRNLEDGLMRAFTCRV